MAVHPLELVDSLAALADCTTAACSNELPGFQIRPYLVQKVGILSLLDAIEAASEILWKSGAPFTDMYKVDAKAMELPPHIDNSFRGLSVHDNREGVGFVQLAHFTGYRGRVGRQLNYPLIEPADAMGDLEQACPPYLRGPVYQGDLAPGVHTVFSQGNMGDLLPAAHYFRRGGLAAVGAWARYAARTHDGTCTPKALESSVSRFKLQVLMDGLVTPPWKRSVVYI